MGVQFEIKAVVKRHLVSVEFSGALSLDIYEHVANEVCPILKCLATKFLSNPFEVKTTA